MPVETLKIFLDQHNVKYVSITHSPAYTAREVAASALVPRREFAKAVIVKLDGRMAMAVLPAARRVNLEHLAKLAGVRRVELAKEAEFRDRFPGCDVGAEPPFGNLYGMDVYVDVDLTRDDEIFFNAGAHTQVVHMFYADYERLVKPTLGEFAEKT